MSSKAEDVYNKIIKLHRKIDQKRAQITICTNKQQKDIKEKKIQEWREEIRELANSLPGLKRQEEKGIHRRPRLGRWARCHGGWGVLSLPGAMYWESRSMNCLTGQLIVIHTAQWVSQARDHWQLRVLQHWTHNFKLSRHPRHQTNANYCIRPLICRHSRHERLGCQLTSLSHIRIRVKSTLTTCLH